MDVARELGLRIPHDLSVAGFDNIPESMHVTPMLTTVDQSIHEMGALAAKMLLGILQGELPEQMPAKKATKKAAPKKKKK